MSEITQADIKNRIQTLKDLQLTPEQFEKLDKAIMHLNRAEIHLDNYRTEKASALSIMRRLENEV